MPTVAEIIAAGTAARQNQRQFEDEMDFRASQAAQANTFGLLNTMIGAQLQKDAMLEAEKLRGANLQELEKLRSSSLMDLERLTQQSRMALQRAGADADLARTREEGNQTRQTLQLTHDLAVIASNKDFYQRGVTALITNFLEFLDQSTEIPLATREKIAHTLAFTTDSIAAGFTDVARVIIDAGKNEQTAAAAARANTDAAAFQGVNVSDPGVPVAQHLRDVGLTEKQLGLTTYGYGAVAQHLTAKPVEAAVRELSHQDSFVFGQPDDKLGLRAQANLFIRMMEGYAPDSISAKNAQIVRLLADDVTRTGDPVGPDVLQKNGIGPHTLTMIRQEWEAFFEGLRSNPEVAKMSEVRDQLIGDPTQNFRHLHPGMQRGDLPSLVSQRIKELGGTVDLTGIIRREILDAFKQPSDGKMYNAQLFRDIVNSGFAANAPEIAHDLGQKYGHDVGQRVRLQLEKRDPEAAERRKAYDALRTEAPPILQGVAAARTELAETARQASVQIYRDGVRAAERANIARAVSRINGVLMHGAAFNQPQVSADIVRAMQEAIRPLEERYEQRWGVAWYNDAVGDARDTVDTYHQYTERLGKILGDLARQKAVIPLLPGNTALSGGQPPMTQPTTQPTTPMTPRAQPGQPMTQPAQPAPQLMPPTGQQAGQQAGQQVPRRDPFAGPLAAYGIGVQPTDRIMNPLGLPPTTQPAGGM